MGVRWAVAVMKEQKQSDMNGRVWSGDDVHKYSAPRHVL